MNSVLLRFLHVVGWRYPERSAARSWFTACVRPVVATLCVAVGIGLYLVVERLLESAENQRSVVARIEGLGGCAGYEFCYSSDVTGSKKEPPLFLPLLFDQDVCSNVVYVHLSSRRIADETLQELNLKDLPSLRHLVLTGSHVSDRSISHLVGLRQLRVLELVDTSITKIGADELRAALPECTIQRTSKLP